MKRTLFLFNPDNDMALANGDENYVPPARIAKMANDLAFLPMWYANKERCVLYSSSCVDEFVNKHFEGLISQVSCLNKDPKTFCDVTDVAPWGWNAMLAKKLRLLGFSEKLIPSDETINRIRKYAHRSFSVSVLQGMLGQELLCGSAKCLYSVQEVEVFVKKNPNCVLKAPWSGSGKGLYWCTGEYSRLLESWVEKVLNKQDCLVGEQVFHKVEDFAMEFYSNGNGEVCFAGYSFFQTNERGAYKGNLLASDSDIQLGLAQYVGQKILLDIKLKLEKTLSLNIGGFYKGYLGVDMMVCRFEREPYYRIHPCVEINLRMNMGMISRSIYDCFISPDKHGYFSIDYFKNNTILQRNHIDWINKYPLVIRNQKIISGYLALTPVNETTNYLASIRID